MEYVPLADVIRDLSSSSSEPVRRETKPKFAIKVSPETLSYPATELGGTSAPQTILITNIGYSKISIADVKVVGPFSLLGSKPKVLEIDETVSIQVTYKPVADVNVTGGVFVDTGQAAANGRFISLSGSKN